MATRITALFILLFVIPLGISAQVTTDTKDVQVAKQKLQVGTDATKWVSSIVETITAAATHRQSPTALAVWELVDSVAGTLGGQIDTFYRSNDTIYLKLVDDTIRFVTLPVSTTNLTFTGATSPITLNSSTGSDVAFKDSTGIAIKQVGQVMTVLNTGDTNAGDDITGGGTATHIPVFTGAQTVTSSNQLIFNAGNELLIGGISDAGSYDLQVQDGIRLGTGILSGVLGARIDFNGSVVNTPTFQITNSHSGGSGGYLQGVNYGVKGYFTSTSGHAVGAYYAGGTLSSIVNGIRLSAGSPGSPTIAIVTGGGLTIDWTYYNPGGSGNPVYNYVSSRIYNQVKNTTTTTTTNKLVFEHLGASDAATITPSQYMVFDNGGVLVGTGTTVSSEFQVQGPGTTTSDFTLIASNATANTATAGLVLNGAEQLSTGTNAPNAAAQFQIESTTKAFLPPRLNTTQQNAISSVPAGLTLHNTTITANATYDGTRWTYDEKLLAPVTGTMDFPSTAAGECSELTITVTGAADGDFADVAAPNASWPDRGTFQARVSAADTVTVRYCNNDLTNAKDPASGTFRVKVSKF